ncbi:MAG TPA: (Fe-S)-binding protein [Vicinamibacterales bacterium]|jgi:Fe-S oxidoreductase
MPRLFAPGCALVLHKPALAARLHEFFSADGEEVAVLDTCCRNHPELPPGAEVINVCPGCDRRYRELYDGRISTVSAWELLACSRTFPFPDYQGVEMTVHDACPTRNQPRVHEAVRALLRRMNVTVVEPAWARTKAVCCGDSFVGLASDHKVRAQMLRRAAAMPRQQVVVYCVSCVKAMHIGGRTPRHLVDLLFGEDSPVGTFEPGAWHAQLDEHIAAH